MLKNLRFRKQITAIDSSPGFVRKMIMSNITIMLLSISFLSSSMILVAAENEEHGSGDGKSDEVHHAVHWTYTGATGPDHWGGLDAAYATCGNGTKQSPIDILDVANRKQHDMHLYYKGSGLNIVNNGHTIQVNYNPGSVLEVDGKRYMLAQFHFHTPSENKVNGENFPMEMHLVHINLKRELAVVSVLMKEGRQSAPLQSIWRHMPAGANEKREVENVKIDVRELLPTNKSYFQFTGSLTTPPCSEGVNWIVLKNPIEVSNSQISKFTEVIGNNARPVNPINDRTIYEAR